MQESHQEMEKENKSKSHQPESSEVIIQELDKKIDELKHDLSKLKDISR